MLLNKNLNKFLVFFLLRPKVTIISFIIGAFLSLFYTYENIIIVTDTDKLISSELLFKKKQKELKEKFPILSNNIVVVLESRDEKLLNNKTYEILKQLEKNSEKLDYFFSPNFEQFYKNNSLLLVSESKRDQIINQLYTKQPFISEIINNPRLMGFNNLLDISLLGLKNESSSEDQKFIQDLNNTIIIFNKSLSDKNKVVWKEVFSDDILRNFIFLKINNDALSNNEFPSLYKLLNTYHKKSEKNLKISFTGGLALDYEEADSVIKGASKAGLFSIALVFLVLFLAFRNLIIISLLILTIILGLFITLGLTTFFIGSLNIISVAFAVLFIGISVDFGIQFCLRSFENKNFNPANIQLTVKSISFSLLIVSITSIIGFLSFVPTDYIGLSELGMISSIGLLVGLISNIIFLPSCCILLNKKMKIRSISKKLIFYKIHKFLLVKSKSFSIFLTIISVTGIFCLYDLNFDSDPMKLKDQKSQSVILALKLLEQNPSSDYTISVFKKEIDPNQINQLLRSNLIKNVFRLSSLELTNEVKDELSYLKFLYLKKSDYFFSEFSELKKLKFLLNQIKNLNIQPISANAELLFKELEKINSVKDFEKLQNLWFGNFDELFSEITALINIDHLVSKDIPELFMKRYLSDDGYERFEVVPSKNLMNRGNLKEFVTYVKSYFPEATGMPIIQYEAGNVVINSFIFALTVSLFFLFIFIYLIFRRFKIVLLCMFPLIFSVLIVSILMRLLKIDLNFANMISLPLLFSLGTSYSIYILKRVFDLKSIDKALQSSTPNAVLFSGLTTIGSFAMLSFSSHYGTSSMGVLLFISLLSAIFSCIVILPFMIKKTVSTI